MLSPETTAQLDQIYGQGQPAAPQQSGLSPDKIAALDKIYGNDNAQPEAPATPSPFGSNRGVAPPNSKSLEDFNKSMVSGAEQAPFWLGDSANALTKGITKAAGAVYGGMTVPGLGGLLPDQQEKFDNPTLPFESSHEVYKDAGAPLYEPKTSLGIFGQLLGNAGGMGAIGEAAPLVDAAAGKVADAAAAIPEGIGLRARGAMAKDADAREAESEAYSNDTSAKYAAFDQTGARLTDESANDLNNAVRKSYADIKIDPVASPKTVSALKNIYQRVTQGKVDPITGDVSQEPLSVGEIDQYRRQLARASYGEDTAAASAARKAIDDHLNNLDESDFVGGESGNAINQLNAARAAAAKEFKFNDLLDIQKKAGGDPNAIKRLMTKYLDKNPNGLSDEELEIFKRATERSPTEALERGLGTFGLDFGKVKNVALPVLSGASGALVPGIGLPLSIAGTAARQTGKWAGRGALEDAMNAIGKRDTSVAPPPGRPWSAQLPANMQGYGPNQIPRLALPAPKTVNYVNPAGQNVPLTEAGRESIGQGVSGAPGSGNAPSAAAIPGSKMLNQYGTARMADADNLPPLPEGNNAPANAAAKTAGIFKQRELEAAAAKKMQIEGMWQQNNVPPEQLVAEAAQRFKDAGLSIGEVGNALMRALKNQQGIAAPRMALLLAAAGALVMGANGQKAATGGIGQQNMQELQKLKPPVAPQSNAAPDVRSFAKAESGGNPNAKNPNSSASGLYQFTNRTWNDIVSRHGKEAGITFSDKANPQAQATMAAYLARDNIAYLQKTLGRMPTKPELYFAHFLGAHGAAKLINAPANQEAITLYPRQTFDSNRAIFFEGRRPRTVAEVRNLLSSKVA